MGTIGGKTLIDKCILSPYVTIGDHCNISNSIISTYSVIADKCKIKNCKIAERAKIKKESVFKNETLQSGTISDVFFDDNDSSNKQELQDNASKDNMIDID